MLESRYAGPARETQQPSPIAKRRDGSGRRTCANRPNVVTRARSPRVATWATRSAMAWACEQAGSVKCRKVI